MEMAFSAVGYAKDRGLIVELSGEDASGQTRNSSSGYTAAGSNGVLTGYVSVTR